MSTPAPGGVAIADRFRLETADAAPTAARGSGGALAAVALTCALIALALLGATAWMLYMNWELIKGV